MDIEALGIMALVIWVGSFAVVAIDSSMKGISPIFWRIAAFFGGPLVLVAYSLIRTQKQ